MKDTLNAAASQWQSDRMPPSGTVWGRAAIKRPKTTAVVSLLSPCNAWSDFGTAGRG